MAEFPQDVTVEILARLPAKSISRFKTVSKPWNNVISNLYFARKHLNHGSKLKILFINYFINRCKMYSADYDKPDEKVMLGFPSHLKWSYNSCDGLFLVSNVGEDDLVSIWNPSTGETHNLPEPYLEDNYCEESRCFYGIGYDHTTENYKVLRIENCACHMPDKNQVCLYTLNSNSWKRLNTIPYKPRLNTVSKMVLLDNKLHFLVKRSNSETDVPELILSFDFSSKVFKEIPLPNYGEGYMDFIPSSYGLCVAFYESNPSRTTELWVMKEYGIQESWEKLFSIIGPKYGSRAMPLYLSENAEILLTEDEKSKYGSNFCKVKSVKRDWGLDMWRTEIYNESLISTKLLLHSEKREERRIEENIPANYLRSRKVLEIEQFASQNIAV